MQLNSNRSLSLCCSPGQLAHSTVLASNRREYYLLFFLVEPQVVSDTWSLSDLNISISFEFGRELGNCFPGNSRNTSRMWRRATRAYGQADFVFRLISKSFCSSYFLSYGRRRQASVGLLCYALEIVAYLKSLWRRLLRFVLSSNSSLFDSRHFSQAPVTPARFEPTRQAKVWKQKGNWNIIETVTVKRRVKPQLCQKSGCRFDLSPFGTRFRLILTEICNENLLWLADRKATCVFFN